MFFRSFTLLTAIITLASCAPISPGQNQIEKRINVVNKITCLILGVGIFTPCQENCSVVDQNGVCVSNKNGNPVVGSGGRGTQGAIGSTGGLLDGIAGSPTGGPAGDQGKILGGGGLVSGILSDE